MLKDYMLDHPIEPMPFEASPPVQVPAEGELVPAALDELMEAPRPRVVSLSGGGIDVSPVLHVVQPTEVLAAVETDLAAGVRPHLEMTPPSAAGEAAPTAPVRQPTPKRPTDA